VVTHRENHEVCQGRVPYLYAGFGVFRPVPEGIHLSFVLPLTFLLRPASKKLPKDHCPSMLSFWPPSPLYVHEHIGALHTVLYKRCGDQFLDKILAVCMTLSCWNPAALHRPHFPHHGGLFSVPNLGPWLPGYGA
jgi:hypothetical protein